MNVLRPRFLWKQSSGIPAHQPSKTPEGGTDPEAFGPRESDRLGEDRERLTF